MQNISLQPSGEPILSGYHGYHQIKSIICSQSKGRDIIFHLNEKKSAEEVTFAFKIFLTGKSLIRSGSENDLIKSCLIKSHGTIPFVDKPLRGKTIMKNGLEFGN